MIAPPRCWSSSGARPADAGAMGVVERARAQRQQRAEQRHVHRGEEQGEDARSPGGTRRAAAAAEGREPDQEADCEERGLLEPPDGRRGARGGVQHRRMPAPDHQELQRHRQHRREQQAAQAASDRGASRRARPRAGGRRSRPPRRGRSCGRQSPSRCRALAGPARPPPGPDSLRSPAAAALPAAREEDGGQRHEHASRRS